MKEYKTIPGPRSIQVDKGGSQAAFDVFADLINEQAKQGWTYHSMETLTVTEKPGCFSQPIPKQYYMLVFEREI